VYDINAYKIIAVKCYSKRALHRVTDIWEGNIKMYLREICCEVMGYIQLAQDMVTWRAGVMQCLD
jgi:hypothetical protein